mgnify:CR=1 FL=1
MTRPGIAADFLANYLPPEIVATLDVSEPKLVKDSFIDEALREHRSDLLFRIRRQTGEPALAYILFEHKSSPDEMVAWQLLRYLIRIWEMLLREGVKQLPPIFPIVFYHGAERWKVDDSFSNLVELAENDPLKVYTPEFRYYLCDLSAYDEQQIKGAALLVIGLRLMRAVYARNFIEILGETIESLYKLRNAGAMAYLQTILRYAVATRKDLTPDGLRQAMSGKTCQDAARLIFHPNNPCR